MKLSTLGISLLAGAYFLTSCSTQKNTEKTVEVKKERKPRSCPAA